MTWISLPRGDASAKVTVESITLQSSTCKVQVQLFWEFALKLRADTLQIYPSSCGSYGYELRSRIQFRHGVVLLAATQWQDRCPAFRIWALNCFKSGTHTKRVAQTHIPFGEEWWPQTRDALNLWQLSSQSNSISWNAASSGRSYHQEKIHVLLGYDCGPRRCPVDYDTTENEPMDVASQTFHQVNLFWCERYIFAPDWELDTTAAVRCEVRGLVSWVMDTPWVVDMSHGTRSQFRHLLPKIEMVPCMYTLNSFVYLHCGACLTLPNTCALVSTVWPKATLLHRPPNLGRMTCICHMATLCYGSIGGCTEVCRWT